MSMGSILKVFRIKNHWGIRVWRKKVQIEPTVLKSVKSRSSIRLALSIASSGRDHLALVL